MKFVVLYLAWIDFITVIGYSNPRTVLNPQYRKSLLNNRIAHGVFFAQLKVSRLTSIVRRSILRLTIDVSRETLSCAKKTPCAILLFRLHYI